MNEEVSHSTPIDRVMMAHALRLAERGAYTTRPNPMVGCVIAHDAQLVGEGWHEFAGEPHAEVIALREAGTRARAATAYVTLEPCAHHGRTPPCAEALASAGVARVVVAMRDPFPRVAGAGLEYLRAAGIEVICGVMEAQAREVNRGFLSRVERGRPWVRVKMAMSLDGRTALANGQSKWITGAPARTDVQRWRARSGAIISGSGTVLADDPQFTLRLPDTKAAPVWRVILDRRLTTPLGAKVLDGSAPTLVLHDRAVLPDARFSHVECHAVAGHEGGLDLAAVLSFLAQREINEVQVEAGPVLCGALFELGLVDELLLYIAPVFLGSKARPLLELPSLSDMTQRWHLEVVDERRVGDDWRLMCRPKAGGEGRGQSGTGSDARGME